MHDKLFDKLCDILDDMERKEKLSASDIQLIDWATHAKKSMLAVDKMDGYSNRGRRRDSMGRYSSSERTYPRYSGKEEYMSQLYDMMDNAPDEKTRQNVHRMIREVEQA